MDAFAGSRQVTLRSIESQARVGRGTCGAQASRAWPSGVGELCFDLVTTGVEESAQRVRSSSNAVVYSSESTCSQIDRGSSEP